MRLAPSEFNRLAADLGQTVLYRPAVMCPCRDPYSGAAQQDCPTCHGRGTFWRRGETTYLALTSLKQAREFRDFGLLDTGDVVLTIPSDSAAYLAGEHDQFMLVQSDQPWTGIFTRGDPGERWPPGVFRVLDITGLDVDREPVDYARPAEPGGGRRPHLARQWRPAGRRPIHRPRPAPAHLLPLARPAEFPRAPWRRSTSPPGGRPRARPIRPRMKKHGRMPHRRTARPTIFLTSGKWSRPPRRPPCPIPQSSASPSRLSPTSPASRR